MRDSLIVGEFAGMETRSDQLEDTYFMQGGELSDLSGPKVSKPKSMWTRIVRMDFGLGSAIKTTDVPLLEKRLSMHNTNTSMQGDEEEVQNTKREKVSQNHYDISARVRSHPCWE